MILDEAKVIGATVGVDVYEATQHASGAWMLFTSDGKKYLPDELDVNDREALVVAVAGAFGITEFAATVEKVDVEKGEVTVGPTKAVKTPKVKAVKTPDAE